jgi:hypothetical protein
VSASNIQKHGAILRQHGFQLVRHTKHLVYRNHEGKVYVCASTPSDWRVTKKMLATLKHVISTPAKPMVVAISDFERQQAAEQIAGQSLPTRGIFGAGKQSRSRGTGFIYDDPKIMTAEQLALTEAQREQARKNAEEAKARRQQERADRRTRKLARREERETERLEQARMHEENIAPFLQRMTTVSVLVQKFLDDAEVAAKEMLAYPDKEFPATKITKFAKACVPRLSADAFLRTGVRRDVLGIIRAALKLQTLNVLYAKVDRAADTTLEDVNGKQVNSTFSFQDLKNVESLTTVSNIVLALMLGIDDLTRHVRDDHDTSGYYIVAGETIVAVYGNEFYKLRLPSDEVFERLMLAAINPDPNVSVSEFVKGLFPPDTILERVVVPEDES